MDGTGPESHQIIVFCTVAIMNLGAVTRMCYTHSVALVRERTIPTERPPPVGEVSAKLFADRGVSRGQRNGSPRPLISVFWTGAATFFIQVAPQLTSRG